MNIPENNSEFQFTGRIVPLLEISCKFYDVFHTVIFPEHLHTSSCAKIFSKCHLVKLKSKVLYNFTKTGLHQEIFSEELFEISNKIITIFLSCLMPASLLRDSGTGVFL